MLIVERKPKSIEAEAYRSLRTNIQYSSFDKKYQTLVVTSANPEEGKSNKHKKTAIPDFIVLSPILGTFKFSIIKPPILMS